MASTPLNKIETTKGPFMAGADRFTITFKGKGGHGALPQQTKDPVVMAGQAIVELQQVVSRRINPLQPAVLSIGKIEGGNAFNVIPDTTSLTGTVRILDKEVQDEVIDEMHKILKGITISYDADYELDYVKGYPPVVNHAKEAEYYLENANEIPGVIGYEEVDPIMGGEDFAYYLEERPGTFFFTGAQIEGHAYPHHHPKFDFDERALSTAAKALIHGYKKYQEDHK